MDINELDLNLQLLRGKAINISGIKVYPLTLDEIAEIGIKQYQQYLGLLCLSDEELKNNGLSDYTTFRYLLEIQSHGDDKLKKYIGYIWRCFLREDIVPDIENNVFLMKDVIIDEDCFNDIVKILKQQNCLEENSNTEEKQHFANEKAREIFMKLQKNRQKIKKMKEEDGNVITLDNLISILSAYSNNLNLLSVYKLTMYQFNNQFNRLKMLKDYEFNICALTSFNLDSSQLDFKHWLRPVEENND